MSLRTIRYPQYQLRAYTMGTILLKNQLVLWAIELEVPDLHQEVAERNSSSTEHRLERLSRRPRDSTCKVALEVVAAPNIMYAGLPAGMIISGAIRLMTQRGYPPAVFIF